MDWWTFLTWIMQVLLAIAAGLIVAAVVVGVVREFRRADTGDGWHRNSECESWKAQQRLEDRNGS